MKTTLTILAALLLAPLRRAACGDTDIARKHCCHAMVTRNVFAEQAKLPFSFTLGGKTSDELLRDWDRSDATRELDAQRREHTLAWIDGKTGLQVRLCRGDVCGLSRRGVDAVAEEHGQGQHADSSRTFKDST